MAHVYSSDQIQWHVNVMDHGLVSIVHNMCHLVQKDTAQMVALAMNYRLECRLAIVHRVTLAAFVNLN